ncbi:MAG: DUF1353 domain-containing protein [Dehalococcoidia bacterium]|jgi:hypothetical protein
MKASYRELHRYKYQLVKDYTIQTDLKPVGKGRDELAGFLTLSPEGLLSIKKYYAWDGPSGPTIDTRDFMRGSLVHDALYQLMREGVLDREQDRKRADEILRELCLEDGMCSFRAWYVYHSVRLFAAGSTKPREGKESAILETP